MKDGAARISLGARGMARGLLDLLLPPMAHDSREATASAGLSPDAWSRVIFLEAPVCDGCGAAFEYDGGDFASDRCLACQVQPYAFARVLLSAGARAVDLAVIARVRTAREPPK